MNAHAYIVAAGGANYGSLREACRRIGVDVELGDDPERMAAATHVILPGVGAAGHAMGALRARGFDRALARIQQPLLGICLGMQLLFEHSEEDDADGIGLLPGTVERLPPAPSWPHMGWNTLDASSAHPLLDGVTDDDWFYFVHGYAAPVADGTLAQSSHGETFSAAVRRGNFYGVQFHPERSSALGARVLQRFLAL